MVQVYTGFGYDGAGACRRIKDQLVDMLTKEGVTWSEVVKKAVDDLSLKENRKEKETADGTVSQLISEAQDLKKLLDRLGED
jgi:dihydroorotate dehydrogenase